MSSDFVLIEKMVLVSVLDAIQSKDKTLLNSLSISSEQAQLLKRVDKNLLFNNLDKIGSILEVNINEDAIKSLLDKAFISESYDIYIKDAILLGATHDIMYKYASMSANDFSKIRAELGLKKKRSATSVSIEEANTLDEILEKCVDRSTRTKVTLKFLLQISKESDVAINAIYVYLIEYWNKYFDF